MKLNYVISALAFTVISAAGVAMAQTPNNTITVTTATSTPSAGSAVTLANIAVTNQSGLGTVQTASIPLTLSLAGGSAASSLTACRLHDANGNALSSGFTPTSGSNTFMFITPLGVGANTTSNLTVRCDVATGVPSGGSFTFALGTQVSGASLGISLHPTPRVAPGAQDTLMALVNLTAGSASSIQISSLPLNVTFGSGMDANYISDCRVRNLTNLASPLNATAMGVVNGLNTLSFSSSLTISAASAVTLAVTCDVSSAAPLSGVITFSLTPSTFPATIAGSTTVVTPVLGTGIGGTAGSSSGNVVISQVATPPTIPGAPNTGFGGTANGIALLLTGLVSLGATALLMRRTRFS